MGLSDWHIIEFSLYLHLRSALTSMLCSSMLTYPGEVTYHLMVLLRLGWLTVLSSRNIVEHELNFFVSSPGDVWYCNACKTQRNTSLNAMIFLLMLLQKLHFVV